MTILNPHLSIFSISGLYKWSGRSIFIFLLLLLPFNHVFSKSKPANSDSLAYPTLLTYQKLVNKISNENFVTPEWRFIKAPGSLLAPAPDSRKQWVPLDGWVKITVPHDGSETVLYTNHSIPDQWQRDRNYAVAWYALNFDFGKPDSYSKWLRFDAVAHDCYIYLNGKEVGRHIGGYTPFEFDISSFVKPGINTLAIWVKDATAVVDQVNRKAISQVAIDHPNENKSVAGIRGAVYFEKREAVHLSRTRIRTSTRNKSIEVETWIRGHAKKGKLKMEVYEWPNGKTPILVFPETTFSSLSGSGEESLVKVRLPWNNPKLWSPENPNLYVLRTTINTRGKSESIDTRFGFREFRIEGKSFMLNGKPIRMRGHATLTNLMPIEPDGSLEYNKKVLGFLKSEFNYNSVRLHATIFPHWAALATDEVGYLAINQSSLWSAMRDYYTKGAEELLPNLEKQFHEWYWRDVNNPSVVIWDVENEMIRGSGRANRIDWVLKLDDFILKNDPKAIIQHSGAAWYHEDQQIIHVHMQEQYSRIMRHWKEYGKVPLILGEFWMGGRGETRLPNGYEYSGREDWHTEEARILREQMLEMRYHGVPGIMCHRLHSYAVTFLPISELKPLSEGQDIHQWRFPNLRNLAGRGLAPVVGFVWPRSASVAEGSPFEKEIVICNDYENRQEVKVICEYGNQKSVRELTLEPTEQKIFKMNFSPEPGVTGIVLSVYDKEGKYLEGDELSIHVIPSGQLKTPVLNRKLVIVPAIDSLTRIALDELKLPYEISDQLPSDAENTIVLVPSGDNEYSLGANPSALKQYLASGGRLLCLPQTKAPKWLSGKFPFWSSVRPSDPDFETGGWETINKDLMYSREVQVYAPTHPVFQGLTNMDFKEWDPIDGRLSDDAFIRPNAVNTDPGVSYRALLGATRRENASLLETKTGKGTALLCQAQVIKQRSNPAAKALLFNMLSYLDGNAWESSLDKVGVIGDITPAELSILTGIEEMKFVPADKSTKFILATNNADAEKIYGYAADGATVLVLSWEAVNNLPGFTADPGIGTNFSGTRAGIVDNPLFWGVASASFLPQEQTPVKAALTKFPEGSLILLNGHCCGPVSSFDIALRGLEYQNESMPLAVKYSIGEGAVIASTIEPFNPLSEGHRQILSTILANAGLKVSEKTGVTTSLNVPVTIPLKFDGQLDDWTNDMEDRNVSPYSRAIPIAITSRDIVRGKTGNDLDLSSIVYLLHDEDHLYISGITFSSGGSSVLHAEIAGQAIRIDFANEEITLNGQDPGNVKYIFGKQKAIEIADTRLLDLTYITTRIGNAERSANISGSTFELSIPWTSITKDRNSRDIRARFRLTNEGGTVLQQPVPYVNEPDYMMLNFGKSRN